MSRLPRQMPDSRLSFSHARRESSSSDQIRRLQRVMRARVRIPRTALSLTSFRFHSLSNCLLTLNTRPEMVYLEYSIARSLKMTVYRFCLPGSNEVNGEDVGTATGIMNQKLNLFVEIEKNFMVFSLNYRCY